MPTYRIPVTGGTLAIDEDGAGPTIVLLHALAMDRRMWEPQWLPLREHFHIARYDLRGYGTSSAPVDRTHVDDLVELLDHLGVARAHLIGLSLGANVAMAAALAHPSRIDRMVLASPGLPGVPFPGRRPPDELVEVARISGREAAKEHFLAHPVLQPTSRDPRTAGILASMVRASPVPQWGNGPQTPPLPAVAERLHELTVPTLVVSGELDLAGYRRTAERVAETLPAGQLCHLAGGGHLCSMDQPTVFTRTVIAFLRDQEQTGPSR